MRNLFSFCASLAVIISLNAFALCEPADAVMLAGDFYQQNVLATGGGPDTYWRLGESSTASPAENLGTQGAAADGTYGSTTALNVPGALVNYSNTAAGFTGGTNTTSAVAKSGYAFPSGSFSSELWVNTSTSGATQGLISYNSPSGIGENDFLLIFSNLNSLDFILSNGPTQTTGFSIADGNWHHIVTTWESSTGQLDIYNNGASILSVAGYRTGISRTPGGSLVLGQEQDGNAGTYTRDANQAFTGFLDEFALYDFVLSPEEILLHYNVGVGNVLPPVPEPSSFFLLSLGALGMVRCTRRRGKNGDCDCQQK